MAGWHPPQVVRPNWVAPEIAACWKRPWPGLTANDEQWRLRRLAPGLALLQQLRAMNQTAAAVGPHGAGTHHSDICPGQGLLEDAAVSWATQLGRTTCRGR